MNRLGLSLLMVACGGLALAIGRSLWGITGLWAALFLLGVLGFASLWFCDKLVLSLHRAQRVGPAEAPVLHAIVSRLAVRARLPMPKVYLIRSDTPNAFATGRNPRNAAVAATTGLLRLLNQKELAGVMAHELAHVRQRDTIAGALPALQTTLEGVLANLVQRTMLLSASRGLGGLLQRALAPIAARLIQKSALRCRELAADAEGAAICGNPLWLASALRTLDAHHYRAAPACGVRQPAGAQRFIVSPLRGLGIGELLSTHPPVADRIRRLEAAAYGLYL